jgi:hypothetical protein
VPAQPEAQLVLRPEAVELLHPPPSRAPGRSVRSRRSTRTAARSGRWWRRS